jgi:hypothetical protein
MKLKELFKLTGIPVLVASLCCLSPLLLVLVGLSTVSFASSLADVFYGEYKWVFRAVGALLLAATLLYHFRKKKNICTLNAAKRHRREIINTVLLASITGILGYIFFLYVVVHYAGVFLGIWADY